MLQKSNTLLVLVPFFDEPTKSHYLMELSRNISLAHTSVKNALDRLVKEEIINEAVEKKGKRKFPVYTASINSKRFKQLKRRYNIKSIEDSGLLEMIEEKLTPQCVVLFGSYLRGEDLEDSDIDLFLECPEEKIILRSYEKKLKRKIQLHFNEDFTKYPSELKNNIINGAILKGFLEAFR